MNTVKGVSVVGIFQEDNQGRTRIEGWNFTSTEKEFNPNEFNFDTLKSIAIENGTYSQVDNIHVDPLESFGIVQKDEEGQFISFQGFNTL